MQNQAGQERAIAPQATPVDEQADAIAALLVAAREAHVGLTAAEKIVRGNGAPRTADLIGQYAANLLVALKRATGEAP